MSVDFPPSGGMRPLTSCYTDTISPHQVRDAAMTFIEIVLLTALITFIVYTAFNVLYLLDLRKTNIALRKFIAKTDENLNSSLAELRSTLGEFRSVSGDIAMVVERVRSAATAVVSIEKAIEVVYGIYRDTFRRSAHASVTGLKAGIKAGVTSLVKNIGEKKQS